MRKRVIPRTRKSGIWLFNVRPRDTPQNDQWVRLTQAPGGGWTYEGWMVARLRHAPTPSGCPTANSSPTRPAPSAGRDDTGWGPFSGVTDFLTAGEEDFPGDDWISNPLNYPFPTVLSLPLDLREQTAGGASRLDSCDNDRAGDQPRRSHRQ